MAWVVPFVARIVEIGRAVGLVLPAPPSAP